MLRNTYRFLTDGATSAVCQAEDEVDKQLVKISNKFCFLLILLYCWTYANLTVDQKILLLHILDCAAKYIDKIGDADDPRYGDILHLCIGISLQDLPRLILQRLPCAYMPLYNQLP